jgi:hypothetical protein
MAVRCVAHVRHVAECARGKTPPGLSQAAELNFLSHFVFKVFERRSDGKLGVEIRFSAGANESPMDFYHKSSWESVDGEQTPIPSGGGSEAEPAPEAAARIDAAAAADSAGAISAAHVQDVAAAQKFHKNALAVDKSQVGRGCLHACSVLGPQQRSPALAHSGAAPGRTPLSPTQPSSHILPILRHTPFWGARPAAAAGLSLCRRAAKCG